MLRRLAVALTLMFAFSLTFASGQSDEEIHLAVQEALRAYSLTTIHASVYEGSVTLIGSVNSCRDRLLANEMVSRIHGVKGIRDVIEVFGPRVPDAQLSTQIKKIIEDRIRKLGGFGFGSIKAQVQDGEVTVSGTTASELAAPAIDAIARIVGVKNVIVNVRLVPRYQGIWRSDFPGSPKL